MSERVSEAAQSCPTLCDPLGYSLPGSSLHGILQARVLEWVPCRVISNWLALLKSVGDLEGKRSSQHTTGLCSNTDEGQLPWD